MQIQELLQIRKERGHEIAKRGNIEMKDGVWIVPSQNTRDKAYQVTLRLDKNTCTCEDFKERGLRCKHIFAVEITITKRLNKNGSTTITQTKRITYPQDWHNYTKAQTEEGRLFKELLKDLMNNVEEPEQVMGRPRVPRKEALFCAIEKVYSMQSSRRAYSLYRDAAQKKQIGKAPSYNVINITLNDKKLTPILKNLLSITAMPLKSVETKFAVDSTGFRTTRFGEYCKEKHKVIKSHKWVKCHAVCGVKTNIITSAEITYENANDSPYFLPLLKDTAKLGFTMDIATADKAYSSHDNLDGAAKLGAIAFIPFRSHVRTPASFDMWQKMYSFFLYNHDKFMEHYHLRSNIETTFFAVKAKFGECLKNKNIVSQTNELLCKLIAYNITVLISAMFELGIEPNFIQLSQSAP
jgi:transposase